MSRTTPVTDAQRDDKAMLNLADAWTRRHGEEEAASPADLPDPATFVRSLLDAMAAREPSRPAGPDRVPPSVGTAPP